MGHRTRLKTPKIKPRRLPLTKKNRGRLGADPDVAGGHHDLFAAIVATRSAAEAPGTEPVPQSRTTFALDQTEMPDTNFLGHADLDTLADRHGHTFVDRVRNF